MSQQIFKETAARRQSYPSITNSAFSDQEAANRRTAAVSLLLLLLSLPLIFLSGAAAFGMSDSTWQQIPAIKAPLSKFKANAWTGEYLFEDVAGWRERGPGGAVPSVTYSVTVSERSGKLCALLEADGFQVSDSYRCTAKAAGNCLNLYYLSGSGGFDNTNTRGYKKNALLLSLIKISAG